MEEATRVDKDVLDEQKKGVILGLLPATSKHEAPPGEAPPSKKKKAAEPPAPEPPAPAPPAPEPPSPAPPAPTPPAPTPPAPAPPALEPPAPAPLAHTPPPPPPPAPAIAQPRIGISSNPAELARYPAHDRRVLEARDLSDAIDATHGQDPDDDDEPPPTIIGKFCPWENV